MAQRTGCQKQQYCGFSPYSGLREEKELIIRIYYYSSGPSDYSHGQRQTFGHVLLDIELWMTAAKKIGRLYKMPGFLLH